MPIDPNRYDPAPVHRELGPAFFDAVKAADFPEHELRYRNDAAAREVGLAELTGEEWINHFSRFDPLPYNLEQPLALRYHGHQFRSYNPDIGDGRGFLFAQARGRNGTIYDLGTKGSGTTPFSRSGDGRLTLKGAVRERLATEMLSALQVPTSQTFSIVETGERLYRGDEPSPTRSAVLVRMQRSHIRIGTFQRLAYEGNADAIRTLTRHCAEHHGVGDGEPVGFLRDVVANVARMGAAWWAAGFVHGVLNTDNIVVTGDSFDYGPWRFLEAHDPGKVAAYFDHPGLYAFSRQPEALSWNLERLAECLLFAAGSNENNALRDALIAELEAFSRVFEAALVQRTHERLGLVIDDDGRERTRLFYKAMRITSAPHQATFGHLQSSLQRGEKDLVSPFDRPEWADALALLGSAEPAAVPSDMPNDVIAMGIEEVEAVWAAIADRDDWSPLGQLCEAVQRMGLREAALAEAVAPAVPRSERESAA